MKYYPERPHVSHGSMRTCGLGTALDRPLYPPTVAMAVDLGRHAVGDRAPHHSCYLLREKLGAGPEGVCLQQSHAGGGVARAEVPRPSTGLTAAANGQLGVHGGLASAAMAAVVALAALSGLDAMV